MASKALLDEQARLKREADTKRLIAERAQLDEQARLKREEEPDSLTFFGSSVKSAIERRALQHEFSVTFEGASQPAWLEGMAKQRLKELGWAILDRHISSETHPEIQRICGHMAVLSPNQEEMVRLTLDDIRNNSAIRQIASGADLALGQEVASHVARGGVNLVTYPDAIVPSANYIPGPKQPGMDRAGRPNQETLNWGASLQYKSINKALAEVLNAQQCNDRSHFVFGQGMKYHRYPDQDRTVRLLISSSKGKAQLHWRSKKLLQDVVLEYEAGTAYCLVYRVNSKYFDHDIEHCPISDQPRNVWVLSLIPKHDQPLKVNQDTVAAALRLLRTTVGAALTFSHYNSLH